MESPSKLETQLSLFPVAESMEAATAHIHSQLPITNANELHSLLAMYQNTLAKEMADEHRRQSTQV
jgi:hypothetical protein